MRQGNRLTPEEKEMLDRAYRPVEIEERQEGSLSRKPEADSGREEAEIIEKQEIPERAHVSESPRGRKNGTGGVLRLALIFSGMILGGYLLFSLFGTFSGGHPERDDTEHEWKEYRRASDSLLRDTDRRIRSLSPSDANREESVRRIIRETLFRHDSLSGRLRKKTGNTERNDTVFP